MKTCLILVLLAGLWPTSSCWGKYGLACCHNHQDEAPNSCCEQVPAPSQDAVCFCGIDGDFSECLVNDFRTCRVPVQGVVVELSLFSLQCPPPRAVASWVGPPGGAPPPSLGSAERLALLQKMLI